MTAAAPAPDRVGSDVLSDVLRTVRLEGALFFRMEVSSPWVDDVPAATRFAAIVLPGAQHVVSYHIVTRGGCWAALAGEPPTRLNEGDVLVIPHGDAYSMGSEPELRSGATEEVALGFFRQMARDGFPSIQEGGGGPERAEVVCGFLGCEAQPFNPVLQSLPRMVHLPRAAVSPEDDRLAHLIEFALSEARERRAGGRCLLLRMSEVLFVEVVRRYLETLPEGEKGWLAGVRDATVGRALALLHGHPTRPWTVEQLAKEAGASRSSLTERFTRLVGEPPMRYLTRWRMQRAARLLSEQTLKVSAVAREVGYESEAAFSRSFKKIVGTPPAEWRRLRQ